MSILWTLALCVDSNHELISMVDAWCCVSYLSLIYIANNISTISFDGIFMLQLVLQSVYLYE